MPRAGIFSCNPLIARQEFPSHYFFVYPPLHSFAFAGWLKVFGISAAAATGYALFNCFLIAAATISHCCAGTKPPSGWNGLSPWA